MNQLTAILAGLVFIPLTANSQILATREAENCAITCANGSHFANDPWASGGKRTPDGWGHHAGDCLEWSIRLPAPATGLKLGVRYAFDERHYKSKGFGESPRRLHLMIDGAGPLEVEVGDTGGWNHYNVTVVSLPPLEAGEHQFWLVSPATHVATDVDAFTFFTERPDINTPGPLRPMEMANSPSGRFIVCATTRPTLLWPAARVAADYDQLFELMKSEYGTEPATPVCVHFSGPEHWMGDGQRALVNRFGIYLKADGQESRADWCWTLAEHFGNHAVPDWFRHSSARVSGLLDWLPALDHETTAGEDLDGAALLEEARAFLDSEQTTDRAEVVHTAVRLKHGEEAFRKFWQLLPQKLASLPEGHPTQLNKHEVVALLSEAAGADVAPFYTRWTGWATEGPVDPLILPGPPPTL